MPVKVHTIPTEAQLTEQIRQVKAHGEPADRFACDPQLLAVLAYGYYRYQEVMNVLNVDGVFSSGQATAPCDVARLVGFYEAAHKNGFAPAQGDESALAQWRIWAHLRLGRGGDPLGDDMEMRATIGDLIDRYEP